MRLAGNGNPPAVTDRGRAQASDRVAVSMITARDLQHSGLARPMVIPFSSSLRPLFLAKVGANDPALQSEATAQNSHLSHVCPCLVPLILPPKRERIKRVEDFAPVVWSPSLLPPCVFPLIPPPELFSSLSALLRLSKGPSPLPPPTSPLL